MPAVLRALAQAHSHSFGARSPWKELSLYKSSFRDGQTLWSEAGPLEGEPAPP